MTEPKPSETAGQVDGQDAAAVAAIADFSKAIHGLLPAIAQDADSGEILMMAWMNAATLRETIETGQATYFSRSRNQPWRKGETSGHRQQVVEVRVDCDRDTILLKVHQSGAACHKGYRSCFFRKVDSAGTNLEVAETRLVDPASVYGKK